MKMASLVIIVCLIMGTISPISGALYNTVDNPPIPQNNSHWWPLFQNNTTHSGYSLSEAPRTNTVKWEYELPFSENEKIDHGPIIIDDKVYVTGQRVEGEWWPIYYGRLWCLNASTGDEQWNITSGDFLGHPVFYNNRIYASSGSDDFWEPFSSGWIECFDATNGESLWKWTTPGFEYGDVEDPVVADGRVYFGIVFDYDFVTWMTALVCLDAENGDFLWWYLIEDDIWDYSIPAIYNDKIYVSIYDGYAGGDPKCLCFDATTGDLIWEYILPRTPNLRATTIAYDRVYIGTSDFGNEDVVLCLDADGNGDGTTDLIWTFEIGSSVAGSSAAAYDKVFVPSDNNMIYCLDAEGNGDGTTDMIWSFTTSFEPRSSPAVADGKVYVCTRGSNRARIICLDAEGNENGTTDMIWNYDTTGFSPFHISPAVAKNCLYAVINNNYVSCFEDLPLPDLEINEINGGILKISSTITNNGEVDANNVEFALSVRGGFLGLINKTIHKSIETLEVGASTTISISPLIGLGPVEIIVTVCADNAEEVTKTANGFVIFFYIII